MSPERLEKLGLKPGQLPASEFEIAVDRALENEASKPPEKASEVKGDKTKISGSHKFIHVHVSVDAMRYIMWLLLKIRCPTNVHLCAI